MVLIGVDNDPIFFILDNIKLKMEHCNKIFVSAIIVKCFYFKE